MKKFSVKSLFLLAFFLVGAVLISGMSLLTETNKAYAYTGEAGASGLYYTYTSNAYSVSDCDESDTTILIPSSYTGTNGSYPVTGINANVFKDFTTLTAVTFEAGSTLGTIGVGAFYSCSSLSSIILPDSVTSINNSTFANCTSLSAITLSSSLTTIGTACFSGCSALTSINIPANVSSIADGAFEGTTALTSIIVDETNATYMDDSDVALLSKSGQTLYRYAAGNTNASYTIPSTATTIISNAFNGAKVNSVTIPSSVTTINSYAFRYSELTSVTVPSTVTSFGEDVFYGCSSLLEATINANITTLPTETFRSCNAMTSVSLSNTITTIEDTAFHSCNALSSITFPTGLVSIGSYAFFSNFALVSITLPSTVNTVGDSAFYNCGELTSINLTDVMTSISANTFRNCVKLATISIPSTITSIGADAFNNCIELTAVTLPNIATIATNTFYNCLKLATINIPSSVTSIGSQAFYGCNLSKIFIPSSVTTITADTATNSPFFGNPGLSIYCQASPTPAGFGEYWNFGSAVVQQNTYWGCFGVSFDEVISFTGTQPTDLTSQTVVPTLTTLSQAGYSFVGWYYESSYTNVANAGDDLYSKATDSNTVTLYAKWTIQNYTITYSLDNGTNDANNPEGYNVETATITLGNATKTGYTFASWNTSSNGEGTNYTAGDEFLITENLSLYPIFEANLFVIDLDVNDGDALEDDTFEIYYGDTFEGLPTPTRANHIFLGWFHDTIEITENTEFLHVNSITLTAHWVITYTITFNDYDGTEIQVFNEIQGTYITAPTMSKTGYTFAGWNDPDEEISFSQTYFEVASKNMTFFAVWEINTFTITFITNGGFGADYTQDFDYLSTANLTVNSFTKTGYSFSSWNTEIDGTGTSYANSASFQMGASSDTLYAIWEINQYTISFDSNGGQEIDDITENYGGTITEPIQPARTGYYFSGWFSDDETFENEYSISIMPAGNITLFAKWLAFSCTITFSTNGGESVASISQYYDTAVTLPDPVKIGYIFLGWFDNIDLSGTAVSISSMLLSTSLYAKWEIKEVSVTLIIDGESVVQEITDDYNTVISLPTPTKEGYIFKGWFFDEECSMPVTNLTSMPADDMTLYASWEIIPDNIFWFNIMGLTIVLMLFISILYLDSRPKNLYKIKRVKD